MLREAGRALPDDVEIDRLLASRLVWMRREREAVQVLRRRIDENVARVECWRDLRATWQASAPELAPLALGSIAVLGNASADELEALRARPVKAGRATPGSFGPAALASIYGASIYGTDAGSPLMAVLATLPEAFSRIYPPDLDGFGLGSRDKITARSGHPLRQLCDRVAAIFGVGEYDLYVHRVRARGVAVELSEPVSILVPASITEHSEAGQVFLVARAFANVAMRLHVADKLMPREIEVLVASAVRAFAPGFGAGLTSEDILDDQMRRTQKALSRKARRALEEATPRYVQAPPIEFSSWCRSVQLGAVRAAALVADDLVATVEGLRKTERDLAHVDPRDLVRTPLVGDLVRFWASDAAIDLRRRASLL